MMLKNSTQEERKNPSHLSPEIKEEKRPADLLFKRYKPSPGHPDWNVLLEEAHSLAGEIRRNLERPQQTWAKQRRRLSAYWTTMKNYMTNRRLAKKGRDDFRPLYFIWTTLRSCNFLCSYCDDHQGKKYPELSNKGCLNTEEGIKLLHIMRTRTPSVYFAGGEPTLRQDLPRLTRTARDLNYYPIIVNTNGSLLHRWLKRENWKTWLADMDIIIVSLDGLQESLLNKMWGCEKSLDVLRNLLMLKELSEEFQFKLMVNTVIQPGLCHEARAVLDFANDLDIWFCPVPQNIGPSIHPDLLQDPEFKNLTEAILARKKEGCKISGSLRMNQRLLKSEHLNCKNSIKPHIDYDGSLIWPCKAAVNVKPEHIPVLSFEDVDSLYQYANEKISIHQFHGPGKNQCGSNCNWAQNYSTDAYYHGLLHPMSLVKDVFQFLRK